MDRSPFLVGIAGTTCSGKTTLEKGLQQYFGEDISTLPFDDMCYRHDELTDDNRVSWEQPGQYKIDEYIEHLKQLKQGKRVSFPANSAQSYNEGITERIVDPRPIVVSVGFLALHDQRARDLFDLKIFLDLDAGQIEDRRVSRDSLYGPINEPELRRYVRQCILPSHYEIVLPQAKYADFIIPATLGKQVIRQQAAALIEQRSN